MSDFQTLQSLPLEQQIGQLLYIGLPGTQLDSAARPLVESVMSIMTEDRDLLSNGLYSRSYGRSPGEVLGYTMVYLRGLQGTGCLGCAKHFPGIGAGEVDTHEEMPVIHLTHDDLIAQDLA